MTADSPRTDRPHIPDYGIPKDRKTVLDPEHLEKTLAPLRSYWLSTVRPDGRPHAVPVWGVWVDGMLHFGGGPDTRKARNLAHDPRVVIHSESADLVAIIEGVAERVDDDDRQERIDDAYEEKYGMRHGPVVWAVHPRVAFGWTEFPKTVTRFTWQMES
jgi:hypothetical protein